MKKLLTALLVVLLVFALSTGSAFAAAQQDSKKSDWHYVITRNNISYSVDMNSIKFIANNMLIFNVMFDNPDSDELIFVPTAVNASEKTYRYESVYILDRKMNNLKSKDTTPTKWFEIKENSPISHIVNYIVDNHPDTKPDTSK
ncbi:MAG: hypothetical protein E6X17_06020 [Sporomusaceae bacterium]|nr:hypothetical protein [Sporomusaceae bacterium]